MVFKSKRSKVFVIGRNKTGTTSVEKALASLGYRMGKQAKAELFVEDWASRDFRGLIKFCKSADAFQDIPFSMNYTYQAMDNAFPGSKFILTVRNDPQEWYDSLVRFHTKIVGKNRQPTADDLKEFDYREKGWLWRVQQLVYGADEETLYNKEMYIDHYESQIKNAQDYFKYRPDDLLTLNVSDADAMQRLCRFLGLPETGLSMPHLNKSKSEN